MKYNFDEIIERRGTNSVKWDLAENKKVLPMWVADMDFKTAPAITKAISQKISEGIFGYSIIPESFYQSIADWWEISHGLSLNKESILAAPGMIPTLSAVVRTFVRPGERIIVQPPVYNHFFTILNNCGIHTVCNDLIYDHGNYSIDFSDLELKASHPETKLLLLCNPHNPVGKSWKKDELEKIAEICSKNQVIVISDEIHADLVFKGHQHTPFIAVAEKYNLNSVTCGSPCKTFNLAGLPISYIISTNSKILHHIQKTLEIQETAYPNPLAAEALTAAYSEGRAWMGELKEYIFENYEYLKSFFSTRIPDIKVTPLEATYLVWLDCRSLNKKSEELYQILLEEHHLWINSGTMYGEAGEGFLRINIACPRILLTEGLSRFEKYIYMKPR